MILWIHSIDLVLICHMSTVTFLVSLSPITAVFLFPPCPPRTMVDSNSIVQTTTNTALSELNDWNATVHFERWKVMMGHVRCRQKLVLHYNQINAKISNCIETNLPWPG